MGSLGAATIGHDGRPAPTLDLEAILARLPELTETIAKDAAKRERERELPYQAFALVRSARLGSLRVPKSLGGPGASIRRLIEVIAQLAAADSNVAHALRSPSTLS
jgi:alkylation response protein AidB-like acyl-CoA dehydrogenase